MLNSFCPEIWPEDATPPSEKIVRNAGSMNKELA